MQDDCTFSVDLKIGDALVSIANACRPHRQNSIDHIAGACAGEDVSRALDPATDGGTSTLGLDHMATSGSSGAG